MIDAHVHFGSLPQGGKLWGDFKEYRKIASMLGINRYCLTPIGKHTKLIPIMILF